MIKHGKPYESCHSYYQASINYIKQIKPKRVLLVAHWNTWLAFTNRNGISKKFKGCSFGNRSYQDVVQILKTLKQVLTQMVKIGVQVHVATMNIQGGAFNPKKMYDRNGVIQRNLAPRRLSQFKRKNKQKIQMFQTAVKQAGAKIIDFSDNLCWQDVCQVTTPYGYGITCDQDHIRSDYSKYWLSSVDHLTDFS